MIINYHTSIKITYCYIQKFYYADRCLSDCTTVTKAYS